MAYYRKRGDKWSFTIDLPRDPITDKRNQRTQGGFNTKKDAQLAAATVLKEITDGTFINEKNITFNEFADEWLAIYSHRAKISSVRIRKHEVDKLKGYFRNHKMKSITKFMYQNVLNDLKALGYSPNTISGIHVTASMLFTSALEQDIIKSSPTVYAKLPKKILTIEEIENEDKKINFLERSELIEFLKTAKNNGLERDFELFLVLAYTGIRVGELCALKWSDISFEDMTISISKTYYNPTNNTTKYNLLTPKTSSSIRTIQVEDLVVSTLKKYKLIQDGLKETNPNYYDQGFVFAKTGRFAGYPEQIKTIQLRMERLLKLAKIDKHLTPHSLRHTNTSLMAEAGVSLIEIMERLGHNDDTITKNVYLHVTNTMKKEAMSKFSALMGSDLNFKESTINYGICI